MLNLTVNRMSKALLGCYTEASGTWMWDSVKFASYVAAVWAMSVDEYVLVGDGEENKVYHWDVCLFVQVESLFHCGEMLYCLLEMVAVSGGCCDLYVLPSLFSPELFDFGTRFWPANNFNQYKNWRMDTVQNSYQSKKENYVHLLVTNWTKTYLPVACL